MKKMNNDTYTTTLDTVAATIKKGMYLSVKRIFDLFFSIIGLVFLIPLAIVVKIIYVCHNDFHSIFFVQDRIGKNGKLFKFFKFRTMIPDADAVLEKLLEEDLDLAKEYKINKKLKNDPRITKIGKLLRKFSLDELPQMINIFLGDMSLIGNRPYLPREIPDMGDYYEEIIKTKPGLTGYWQVSGRNNVTFKDRLRLEKEYSQIAGFRLDVKIFFKTFKVVVFGKGAE